MTRLERTATACPEPTAAATTACTITPGRKKWVAQITFKSRTYYLGSFYKLEDAVDITKGETQIFANFFSWYYGLESREKQVGVHMRLVL